MKGIDRKNRGNWRPDTELQKKGFKYPPDSMEDKPRAYLKGFIEGYRSGKVESSRDWQESMKTLIGILVEKGLIVVKKKRSKK